MKRVLLPSFGAHLFDLEADPETPTLYIPPIVADTPGWDLDYSSLLLFEKILIDKASYEYIRHSSVLAHQPLKESIRILIEEDIVELSSQSITAVAGVVLFP